MTTTPTVTNTLVEGARTGDPEAWNRIVTEIGPKIRGYARARGIADADDLTQDVLVAAAARIEDFDGDDRAFRSWLFAIAYRRIVDRYRASAKRTAPLPETLPDGAGSPEDQVIRHLEATEAVAALDVLGEVERDVVLMRVVGGLDTADVAAAVGKRVGNVRVIQSRAMGKLRAELRRRGYGSAGVWAAALVSDVIGPIGAAEASAAAGAAVAAVAAGAAGAGAVSAVGTSAVAKTAAAVLLAAAVGGAGAVTGNLPDPAQRWVADVAERIGVGVTRPAEASLSGSVDDDRVIRGFPTALLPVEPPAVPPPPTVPETDDIDPIDATLLDDDGAIVDTTLSLP